MNRETHRGYLTCEDGARWLRIEELATGEVWEEPLTGWQALHCLTAYRPEDLGGYYAHSDGRTCQMGY